MGMMASDSPVQKCCHCGMYHVGSCSRIKSIEYYPTGRIKRVQYHTMIATDWPLVETDMDDWKKWAEARG